MIVDFQFSHFRTFRILQLGHYNLGFTIMMKIIINDKELLLPSFENKTKTPSAYHINKKFFFLFINLLSLQCRRLKVKHANGSVIAILSCVFSRRFSHSEAFTRVPTKLDTQHEGCICRTKAKSRYTKGGVH